MAKVGKKAKGPMRSVQRGVGQANVSLKSIASVLDQQQDALKQIQENSAAVQDQKATGGASGTINVLNDQLDQLQNANDSLKKIQAALQKSIPKDTSPLQKNQVDYLKKLLENSNKQIAQIAGGNKEWKGFKDKLKDLKSNLKESIDPDNIKKALLGPFKMFKGVRDKVEDIDYMKRNKAMGFTGTKKELKEQAVASRKKKEELLRNEDQYQKMKKSGASDEEIAKANPEFVKKRAGLLKEYKESRVAKSASSAPLAATPSDKGKVAQSTTDVLAEKTSAAEDQAEQLRNLQAQTDLLQQIALNTAITAGKKPAAATGGKGDGVDDGTGPIKGVAASLGKIGNAVAGVGKGIGLAIGGVFQGIMEGIANGIKAFANAKVLAGTVVLGLLTAVIYGLSKAVESFADIDWETFGKAGVAILGLIAAGSAAGALIGLLGLGAVALGLLGGSLWVIGKGMEAMGDNFDRFIDGLERLTAIDVGALVGLSGGLLALSAAMAAFGAGQAAAGLGSFVGNLLTSVSGGKTPVEQIVDIGNAGAGVKQAAEGISSLGQAMKAFGDLPKDALKPLKQFPWEEATKFVAAGGSMSVSGAKVENASRANADQNAKVDGANAKAAGSGGGNVVNAQQNNQTTNVMKPTIRNNESSYNRYLQARY